MDLRATVNQDKGDRRELPSTQKSPSGWALELPVTKNKKSSNYYEK